MSKTWFVTGASRGFGRSFVQAALQRGDRVAATARDTSSLDDLAKVHGEALLPLALDVTDRAADFATVDRAFAELGTIDVVVNNAGYGLRGAAEEASADELRAQVETNLYGAIWVTQAALPHLRAQGSGHIVQISSIGGVAGFPTNAAYHASKWGLEGWTESMAQEVAPFGIKVTIVEPSGFRTDWGVASRQDTATHLAEYDEILERNSDGSWPRGAPPAGDPDKAAQALLQIVDMPEPPLRLLMGNMAYDVALQRWSSRSELAREYEALSRGTDD